MSTPWLRYRSALALSLFFPWFPALPSPPGLPPLLMEKAAGPGEAEKAVPAPAPTKPLVLPGVVIEEIPKGSALEKAGLQVGDVILSWERLPNPPANPGYASGKFQGPFDWMWLEIEQAPRGVVRLIGERDGTPLSYEIVAGRWAAEIAPNFTSFAEGAFRRGRLLEQKGEGTSAIAEWRSLASWLSQEAILGQGEAWLNIRIGKALATLGSRPEAKLHYLRAIERTPDEISRSLIWDLAAGFSFENGELSEAERYFQAALEQRKYKKLGELSIARNMSNIATVIYHQGRRSEADSYLRSAYEVYAQLAPQAPMLVGILRNLGIRARELGNLNDSLVYQQKSVALADSVSPNTTAHADSLHELGTLERDSGRLREANVHLSQALKIREDLEPGSARLANTLNALSLCYRAQGDLDQALVLARRSLSIAEVRSDAAGHTAAALNSIALIENALGQWPEAEIDLIKALELAPKSGQAQHLVPMLLANMAMVQENQGNFSVALLTYLKALDLKKQSGATSEIAPTLRSLGIINFRLRKPQRARTYLVEALSIQRKTAPDSLDTADTLGILAAVLAEGGDLVGARQYLAEALNIVKTSAPRSSIAASIYSNYGVVQQRLGALAVARQSLEQAVDLQDSLFFRASHSHAALSSFGARNDHVYFNAADMYVAMGEGQLAMEVAERGRGRSLRMLLAERDLHLFSDIPAQVAERLRNLEKSLDEMATRDAGLSENVVTQQDLQAEWRVVFKKREQLLAEIRRSSPRLAALSFPLSLAADEIQGLLDPGTLLATFLVGATGSYLFTVSRDEPIRVQILPIGESDLRQQIERFRGLLAEARSGIVPGELRSAAQHRMGKNLYNLLLAPAADRIQKAERVLIVADGPLHYLPLGALVREVSGEDGLPHDQYVAEWKPFHFVLSATVYSEIKKDRRDRTKAQEGSQPMLRAFGDPQFPQGLKAQASEQISDIRVRSAVRRGTLQFERLPYSRLEIESIASLFPPGQAEFFLGTEATEERVKAIGKGTRILHFATHARLDERFPLNSAVVLNLPDGFPEDRENGLLQVWEIFEKVRLDADLVVLSGCETALGEEQGGEGLIGLTRAFQYAGARSVMASLWSVQDQATSELMIRFYKHLRAGLPKDEALQQAQIELIRGPIEVVNEKGEKTLLDASAPYFWAGFQVYGDWQ